MGEEGSFMAAEVVAFFMPSEPHLSTGSRAIM